MLLDAELHELIQLLCLVRGKIVEFDTVVSCLDHICRDAVIGNSLDRKIFQAETLVDHIKFVRVFEPLLVADITENKAVCADMNDMKRDGKV